MTGHALVLMASAQEAEMLLTVLHRDGFEIERHTTLADGLQRLEGATAPRLLLIGADLPDSDLVGAVRRVREHTESHLVAVVPNDEEDLVLGALAAGADDVVVQPVRPRVLRARIHAVLRRPLPRRELVPPPAPPPASPPAPAPADVVVAGDRLLFRGLDLATDTGRVLVDGNPVPLPQVQVDLLEVMLYAGPDPRSAAELAAALRGEVGTAVGPGIQPAEILAVVHAMEALLTAIGDLGPSPRWIARDPAGYRLVRAAGGPTARS